MTIPSRAYITLAVLTVALFGCSTPPHGHHHAPRAAVSPPVLFDDLGTHHQPITTSSARAQQYFDQGLRLVYAFNHYEAQRAFQEAARLDPGCAMCYWGIALTYGSNYNSPTDAERERGAWEAIQRARALGVRASERERAVIEALATRHSESPATDRAALDRAYADAMREVTRRFPADMDSATLYADALMNVHPWRLWTADGRPQPGTEEIVRTLERVLAVAPNHPGANHLYIHAVEASPDPQRAVGAADRLGALMPGAGHIVHMPSHIYIRVGRYADAVAVNHRAAAADRAYFRKSEPSDIYRMMYYPHNLDFVWIAASMDGRAAETIRAAGELAAAAPLDMVRKMSDMEIAPVAPLVALARFGRWQDVLQQPAPDAALPYLTGIWHYTRGLAFNATGRAADAASELATVRRVAAGVAEDRTVAGFFKTRDMLALAAAVLDGEIAARAGAYALAVTQLTEAVRLQDEHWFTEPPPWYYPVRQSLGAVLLQAGRAAEAETVYQADLQRNPDNGWSLFGLAQALRAQGKTADAAATDERFRRAWARADVTLTASRF
jgi:tetratricopeptide (TPR) repeat protein